MGNFWLKFKVWTKVVLFGLLLIYVTVFIVQNSEKQATMWVWFGRGSQVTTSVLKLVLAAFLLGVLGTMLVRTTFRTVRQIREVRARGRSERLERDIADMKTKAGMLRPRTAEPEPAASPAPSASLEAKPDDLEA